MYVEIFTPMPHPSLLTNNKSYNNSPTVPVLMYVNNVDKNFFLKSTDLSTLLLDKVE